ncbi:MAG: hypothetical protein ABR551_09210 [Gemmatimonadales bacterium]
MRPLSLRVVVMMLALAGLAGLALQQGRATAHAADRVVAMGVAGYLVLTVPAAPATGFAADRLVSTVSRLHGAAFWHAGLQVTVGGTNLGDEAGPPGPSAHAMLPGPSGVDTVGSVTVWDTVSPGRLPGVAWLLAVALILVSVLAATRRAGLLWPTLGGILVALTVRLAVQETSRMADHAAEAAMSHLGPMAALVVLDPRVATEALGRLGDDLRVREVGQDGITAPPGWGGGPGGRLAVAQVARGSGAVVEVGLPPLVTRTRGFELGLAGGALVAWLATWPPFVPGRRRRLLMARDDATIPG